MKPIPFFKMSGSGNDFILIDHRSPFLDQEDLAGLVPKVCRRRLSVGADGLILIEKSDTVDFKWQFFNADGTLAEMCGNGARCAARFAYLNGIAGAQMKFSTTAGVIEAEVNGEQVKIRMTDPFDLQTGLSLAISSGPVQASAINTGVPHVVRWVEDLDEVAVTSQGSEIRFHPAFAPAGTNVNFACRRDETSIRIRTYERGVEDETLACGTGSVACALMAAVEKGYSSPVAVHTRGGGVLKIYFQPEKDGFGAVYMEGDARVIYQAEMWTDAWNW